MQDQSKSNTQNILDVSYIANLFKKHYIFIGACIIFLLALAYAKNKFATRIYKVATSIVIYEDDNSFAKATNQLLQGVGFGNSNKNFANELQTINSTPVITEALQKLDFGISYYYHDLYGQHELYKSSPFLVILNKNHVQPVSAQIYIEVNGDNTFTVKCKQEDADIYSFISNSRVQTIKNFEIDQPGKFGEDITSDNYDFKIVLSDNSDIDSYKRHKFSFRINTLGALVRSYHRALKVEPPDIESTIAQVSIETPTPSKDVDFLNSLAETYLNRDVKRKNYMSEKTIEYIDRQLNVVQDSLRIAEENLQNFKSSNKIVDISMQSGQIYDEVQQLEQEKAKLVVKMKYFSYIQDYFKSNNEYSDLITPSGMGIDDPLLNNLIDELIKLNTEKAGFIQNDQEKSPYLKRINIRIDNLKSMITENIAYISKTTDISLKDMNSRIYQLNAQISKLPKTERKLVGIERKFKLNDAIYTFLLQRRADAEISKASYLSDTEIIEPAALVSGKPISPKSKINYIMSFMLGLILPFTFLRLREILRNTFSDRYEIESQVKVPISGRIYNNNKKVESVVKSFPKSHVAESFRMLRSNLNYLIPEELNCKTILVTSLISQEGKSFSALNIACSLALANYKVILLGFDLRKPRLYDRMDVVHKEGLSAYLSNQAILDDIIQHSNTENLDVIVAGDEPPNPSELISSMKVNTLLDALKEIYNYIIIDSAPIGIVSDSFELLEKADLNLLVTRIKRTPRRELFSLINELKARDIKNLSLVINDIPLMKKTKYGYGYYEDVSPKKKN